MRRAAWWTAGALAFAVLVALEAAYLVLFAATAAVAWAKVRLEELLERHQPAHHQLPRDEGPLGIASSRMDTWQGQLDDAYARREHQAWRRRMRGFAICALAGLLAWTLVAIALHAAL